MSWLYRPQVQTHRTYIDTVYPGYTGLKYRLIRLMLIQRVLVIQTPSTGSLTYVNTVCPGYIGSWAYINTVCPGYKGSWAYINTVGPCYTDLKYRLIGLM